MYFLESYMFTFLFVFFFFNDTATTEIYTLSLHDALPISRPVRRRSRACSRWSPRCRPGDRKSTRLNSSHLGISYAVFCLKKKKHNHSEQRTQPHNTHRDRDANVEAKN